VVALVAMCIGIAISSGRHGAQHAQLVSRVQVPGGIAETHCFAARDDAASVHEKLTCRLRGGDEGGEGVGLGGCTTSRAVPLLLMSATWTPPATLLLRAQYTCSGGG
jgi:hypothetical protein